MTDEQALALKPVLKLRFFPILLTIYLQYSHVTMSLAAEAFVSQIAGNVFTFLGVFIIVCKASLNQLIPKNLFLVLHVYQMQRCCHYLLTSGLDLLLFPPVSF